MHFLSLSLSFYAYPPARVYNVVNTVDNSQNQAKPVDNF